ncbi:MAG: hypothetical protein JNM06_07525 [Blastocatellia bacterium]|nr:hypothetical protein [Blastocatellia bacterium]
MSERVLIVGLDETEHQEIISRINIRAVAHELLPQIIVKDGVLQVESRKGPWLVTVDRVVFHAIYENDLDFFAGLVLWGGPCLPNARAMMDARLKIPCLARALEYTRFGLPLRGYAGPGTLFQSDTEKVAKWGNWHCGENKERFTGNWTSSEACIIEDFLAGQAVRLVIIGDKYWQIRLEGESWLKSIHSEASDFMEVDQELLEDTKAIGKGFGLEILANDYIVTEKGTKHLLEVNHIPNVTRFPELWQAYADYVVSWINNIKVS